MIDKPGFLVTLAIIAILVMASPTQADVNVADTPPGVTLGGNFEFDLEISAVGKIDFLNVTIQHEGDESLVCDFEPKGRNLKKDHPQSEEMPSACRGIKIMKPGLEYGYGYGGNGFKYRVRVETNKGYIKDHGPGEYTIVVTVNGGTGGSDSFDVVVEEAPNQDKNNNSKKKK